MYEHRWPARYPLPIGRLTQHQAITLPCYPLPTATVSFWTFLGESKTPILDKTVSAGWPAEADKVTAENWYLECISNIDGNGTEGFVAVAPNGDRYRFDKKLAQSGHHTEYDTWTENPNPNFFPIYRKRNVWYDSLGVTGDHRCRIGTGFHFDYNTAGYLVSITSNDGRRIEIPRTGPLIETVIAKLYTEDLNSAPRTWTYTYQQQSTSVYRAPLNFNGDDGTETKYWITLTTVTLPDTRQWHYNLIGLYAKGVPGSLLGGCKQVPKTVSVTHPDGVTGTFKLEEIQLMLGRYVPGGAPYCPNTNSDPPEVRSGLT